MIQFSPIELSEIMYLRDEYLNEIKLSQELMLEWLINEGHCFIIQEDLEIIGYFIKADDDYLLEFYLKYKFLTRKEEVFQLILEQGFIKNAFCKSFDSVLLTCCHTFSKSNRIFGTIFRDYSPELNIEWDKDFQVRLATEEDISRLLKYESELYESPEELNFTVSNRMLHMFEKGGNLIGCGYLIHILPNRNFYDIGMWTNPEFRGQGYAKKIISYLKIHCLEYGYEPVCGCEVNNIASRKALEANGFVSKHCVLLFSF